MLVSVRECGQDDDGCECVFLLFCMYVYMYACVSVCVSMLVGKATKQPANKQTDLP